MRERRGNVPRKKEKEEETAQPSLWGGWGHRTHRPHGHHQISVSFLLPLPLFSSHVHVIIIYIASSLGRVQRRVCIDSSSSSPLV